MKRPRIGIHTVADGSIAVEKWRITVPWFLTLWLWRHRRGVGAVFIATLVLFYTGKPLLAGVAIAVLCGLPRLMRRKPRKRVWWDEQTLAAAMVSSGILSASEGALPPLYPKRRWFSRRGKPVHTDRGTTVVVRLPQSQTLTKVLAKQENLAAALHVPLAWMTVTQDEHDPAGVVRIFVSSGPPPKGTVSPIAYADSTLWRNPVRIGLDLWGNVVNLETFEANTLVAGRPGSGKTTSSRVVLGHYLLDPTTQIYLLDGKGSVDDYGAARSMCSAFVSGTEEDAAIETIDMLAEVLDLVRRRNSIGGKDHAGVLVLLEEFQDVRSSATKPQRETLDVLLGRIVRMGRAVSVHVLVSTQRPTVDDLPSGTRNLLSQRLSLMLRNAADVALVLGAVPGMALPSRRGQGLFTNGGPVVAVELDLLDNDHWTKVCSRAAKLRRHLAVVPALPTEDEPLIDEVTQILTAAPRGLKPQAIFDRLSEQFKADVRSVQQLGITLARHPRFTRGRDGDAKVWRLKSAPGV